MTPLQRALLLALLTSGIAAVAGPRGPAAPPAATLLHVAPAVRRIIQTLREIDIPPAWRRRNWIGDRGQGSCVHAALVNLWHWQGRHEFAERWAARHGNGETAEGLAAKLDAAGARFAETRSGDEAFLEWAIRTRRGAAVVVQNGVHMVNLVGLDQHHAHILDSNSPARVLRLPRDAFLRDWKQSGGWAVTPVGTPPPPEPWVVREKASPVRAGPRRAERRMSEQPSINSRAACASFPRPLHQTVVISRNPSSHQEPAMSRLINVALVLGSIAVAAIVALTFNRTAERLVAGEERIAALESEAYHSDRFAAGCRCSGTAAAQERVIDLPEDGNQWHTILILRAGWQSLSAERRAEAMFHTEPLLVSLKHQTHWHLITTDQTECAKFRALVDATPCLIVERANGQVVYRESGPDLGRRPHALTHAIRKEIERHCPDGRCLPLHPVPGRDEEPSQDEVPAVLRETPAPAEKKANFVPAAVIGSAGLFAGFAWKFKRAAGF